MRIDAELLSQLDEYSTAILHFYDWEGDSATYGYLVNPSDFINLEKAKDRGLSLARRPTGGGIVFHLWDLAFSVLVPSSHPLCSENTLENYQSINQAVQGAVEEFITQKGLELITDDAAAFDASCKRFCMAMPTKYDLVVGGRKIAGAAQRRTKKGFLHQGTIALLMPPEDYLQDVLLPSTRVLEAMKANTFPLIQDPLDLPAARLMLKSLLEKSLTKAQDYEMIPGHVNRNHTNTR